MIIPAEGWESFRAAAGMQLAAFGHDPDMVIPVPQSKPRRRPTAAG